MAFKPIKQYVISVTGTPSTALNIPELETLRDDGLFPQVVVYAKTTDIVLAVGGSGVASDEAVTSSALAALNAVYAAGSIQIIGTKPKDTHVSAVSLDGSTAGTLYLTIGYGEEV